MIADMIREVILMLAAVQGVIRNNLILVQNEDISPYDGRVVTIIINEEMAESGGQDKSKFFDAVGKIDVDGDAVNELRETSMI